MESEDIEQMGAGNGPPALRASGQISTARAEAASPDGEGRSPGQHRAEAEAEEAPRAGANSLRRTLKLVVTLQPTDSPTYRVILALGADGCDPLFRAVSVANLAAALEEVPGLLAEAEARWRVQPRYPTVVPQRAKTAGQRLPSAEAARPDGEALHEDGSAQSSDSGESIPKHPASRPNAKPAGQLSLFQ